MTTTYLIHQDFHLTTDLIGNLWYIRTLGDKLHHEEQQGLFLIHTTYPADANPDDFQHFDIMAFEAWWQLGLPSYSPWDEQLRIFRESGVLWLDHGQLSRFFPHYILPNPTVIRLFERMFPATEYYAAHRDYTPLLTLEYRNYRAQTSESTRLLIDYLSRHAAPDAYNEILFQMREHLQALYTCTIEDEPKVHPLWPLCLGMNMIASRRLAWWNATSPATLSAYGDVRESFAWEKYSIAHVLLATILASYWMAHPDLDADEPYHPDLTTIAIPLPERLQLWKTYLSFHHDRIANILNLEDTRTALPTDDEIRHFLLREELAKTNPDSITTLLSSLSTSPIPDTILSTLTTRLSTYTSQFLQFLGYTPSTTPLPEPQSTINNHQSSISTPIPPECTNAIPKVIMTNLRTPNGVVLDARVLLKEALGTIDATSPVQLALLLMVARETKVVKSSTQPTAFVRMLVGIGALPMMKDEDLLRISRGMSKKIKGQKVCGHQIPPLSPDHTRWPAKDRPIGDKLYSLLNPTNRMVVY